MSEVGRRSDWQVVRSGERVDAARDGECARRAQHTGHAAAQTATAPLFAIYGQPHLSFGSLGTTAGGVPISGATGTFLGTVLGEVTLIDRLFVGYGILNNPSGPAIDLRTGGYPLMSKSTKQIGRKGLMLGVDFRSVFVSGATGTLFMFCLGYDSF